MNRPSSQYSLSAQLEKYKSYLIFPCLLLLISIKAQAQQWVETKKELTDVFDNELYIYGSIIAYVSDKNGNPKARGRFVTVKNFSSNLCYYRAYLDAGYRSPEDIYKRITISSVLQYLPVPPETTRQIDIGSGTYFTQAELKKMVLVYLEFKYVRGSGQPSQQAETESRALQDRIQVDPEDLIEPCDQILFKSTTGGVGFFYLDKGQQELLTSGVFAYAKLSDQELIKNCWINKLEGNSISFNKTSIKLIQFGSNDFDKAFEDYQKMMFETYKDYNVNVINIQD